MAVSLTVFVFFSLAGVALASGCDYDVEAAFRDAEVARSFDPAKMKGLWYEHGFADPAQVGASCQTLNGTYDAASGTLNTDFAVYYGPIPFTITEHYVPHDQAMKGVYRKSVSAPFHIPGGGLVGLKTAIVKADLSSDKTHYTSVVIHSCLLSVNELVIATRSPVIADSDFQALVTELKDRGVPSADKLKRVDWSQCKKQVAPIVVV